MSEELQLAFQLLATGMITVFLVLLLVVQSARILIALVNKYAPESAIAVTKSTNEQADDHDAATIAVLTGVVANITSGQGKIKSIKKIK